MKNDHTLPQKYTKRSTVVEAMQFTQETKDRVFWWAKEVQNNIENSWHSGHPIIRVPTVWGIMECHLGDWVIKKPLTETRYQLYLCKSDTFERTYQRADHSSAKTISAAIPVVFHSLAYENPPYPGENVLWYRTGEPPYSGSILDDDFPGLDHFYAWCNIPVPPESLTDKK